MIAFAHNGAMQRSWLRPALAGTAALAVAMGIGRFAFTPILPMMQAEGLVDVVRGGWLASANYAGYLAGGLIAAALALRPGNAIRAGLVLVALGTLAMAFTQSIAVGLALRAVAGIASAWVLVFASVWLIARVEAEGAPQRVRASAWLFSGVGIGIVVAGLACFALDALGARSRVAWGTLGVLACAVTALTWGTFSEGPAALPRRGAAARIDAQAALLIACYAAFGFGYIVPATFLSAMAREAAAGSAWYGLAWPLFGAAAAASTFAAAPLRTRWGDRRLWAAGHAVMAVGVALPLLSHSALAVTLSGLLVGLTFMVVTMAGLQEARRMAPAAPQRLMAAMTSSFAAGQIAGPLVVSASARLGAGYAPALGLASALLVITSLLILATARKDSA
jgi:predicted MFS family arabinose efflux permease